MNPQGGQIVNMLASLAPEAIKSALKGFNNKIKTADAAFTLTSPTIDGQKGSYDKTDIVGRGANAGEQAVKLNGSNKLFTDIQYIQKDTDGKLNLNSGLASLSEVLKAQDRNGDGKVSVLENLISGQNTPDLDNNGFITNGEALAEVMVLDKNGDGKISYAERLAAGKVDEDTFKTSVQKKYTDNKIADLEKAFKMPEKTETDTTTDKDTFMQFIMLLFKQLFGF